MKAANIIRIIVCVFVQTIYKKLKLIIEIWIEEFEKKNTTA